MKIAITVWNGRVAPLFDVAKQLLIVERDPVRVETTLEFSDESLSQKVELLLQNRVTTLICGGISREYEEELLNANIEVISYVAGDVADILEAWQSGVVNQRCYSMPGCMRPRFRCRGRGGRGGGPHGRGCLDDHLKD
jgi:predicted Fe-Mo cluster-binding NifX family protein